MYSYTTTSNSHPAHRREGSSTSSPYTYTTTSTSSQFTYSTTSASSPYTYSTTSTLNNNEKYRFSVTSDYIKRKINKYDDSDDDDSDDDDNENENENVTSERSTSSGRSSTSKTKDCSICIETYNLKHFIKITNNCIHSNDICRKCVVRHIETQLNTKGDVEGILCPFGNDCGFLIEYNDVQRIVKGNLFERYDSLALKQALSNMPDFRWCKNAGCGSGQIHSGSDKEPIMTCKACGEKSCYTHDIPWHDNLTCEQYNEAKKGEDMATQDLLNRETKKCPKCGVRITKNGGCNHMTCRVQNCRHEFCWLCLADFEPIRRHGNHFHERTCQLYV
ncbi:hypothetical protein GLOIN_2v1496646 [Rhizophagus clarus]|uniref:RBR-type E3 ubiquitin transferase n=1 Tax=Rhizophagus clarus TaxID=94130 RepID=A0A8H3L5R7_9GLOM|nr:hypothetical protein GLOIN_2v1496646 [Rhizophagus clarus]